VAAGGAAPHVVLWDRFENMANVNQALPTLAMALMNLLDRGPLRDAVLEVSTGKLRPLFRYELGTVAHMTRLPRAHFDLVYSQAALEHVWEIAGAWEQLAAISRAGGWQSHQIDLMDHGRRETNYLEMCEWSAVAYYCTMRWVPGGLNRWRAGQHLSAIRSHGLRTAYIRRVVAKSLPVDRERLAEPFRSMEEEELLTTAVEVVAQR
jgi:hypothetical protein